MASIGDLYFALHAIGAELILDVTKAADQAGAAGAKTLNQKLSAGLKGAAFGAVGAAAGAAFGVALKGGLELDTAMRQLQADTGMTAEEAKQASHALAGMFGENLQGFDEIGAAMAKVHNDLGLTGEAADATTEAFLRFGTATGINAATAVGLFDDALDTWGLTAADTQTIMDKVIVSHQKWGGEIEKNLVTLAKVAPAMTAANFTIDDGIALLGLFGAKGLDSERAAAAFAKALTKVKSPAELQRLIDDISNTPDPFERAAKAADLFGAKAGAQLANALGGVHISDFTVSMEEAAGATETAADAIESGFGAQFQLIMKKAGGALASFGSEFGPLLMVASAFGPKFITAIGAGLGGLAGIIVPKVLATMPAMMGASEAVGLAGGTAMGTAIGVGLAAAAVVAIGIAFVMVKDALDKQGADLVVQATAWATAAGEAELLAAREANEKAKLDLAAQTLTVAPILGPLANVATQGARDALDATGREIETGLARISATTARGWDTYSEKVATRLGQAGEDAGKKLTVGLEAVVEEDQGSWTAPILRSGEELVRAFGTSIAAVQEALGTGTTAAMEGMANAITAARQKPLSAFETMVSMLKNAMTPTQEAARIAGQLISTELARGLRSKDPAVRAQAIAVRRELVTRLREIQTDSGVIGGKAGQALADGLKSKDPAIRRSSELALAALTGPLAKAPAAAQTAGERTGAAFVRGVRTGIGSATSSGWVITVKGAVRAGKETFAAGSWNVPATEVALVHRGEIIVPASVAADVRSGQATIGAGGSGQTINIAAVNLADAHDERSVIARLRFLSLVGG